MKWVIVVALLPTLTQGNLQAICPPGHRVPAALVSTPLHCLQTSFERTSARLQHTLEALRDELQRLDKRPVP